MSKLLLAILLLIVSLSFVAENIFIFKYNIEQTILSEEEAKSEKESESKLDSVKDKIFSSHLTNEQYNAQAAAVPVSFEYLDISKGFTDKPYTPPELS